MSLVEFITGGEEGRSLFSYILLSVTVLFILSFLFTKIREFLFKLKHKKLPPYEGGIVPYFGLLFSFGKHPLNVATNLYKKVFFLFL